MNDNQQGQRSNRFGTPWIWGIVLIVLGIGFLLQNLGVLSLENWWALFILIPAIGAFGTAWRVYQDAGGRLTARARTALIGGVVLTMITAVFLLGLNWEIIGPALLILVGLGLLINALLPQ